MIAATGILALHDDLHPEVSGLADLVAGWHTPPSVAIGLLVLGATHLWATGPGRERLGLRESRSRLAARRAWWLAGLATLFLALTGPLHDLADYFSFAGHMVQHLLITLVAPPLLILGVPRGAVELALGVEPVRRGASVLVRPLVAGAIFSVVLVIWHLPELYDLTLQRHAVHIAEHLLFIVTAVIMWWPVLSPYAPHRASPGIQMIYLFLLGLPMKAVGAVIALSDSLLYPFYAEAPRIWSFLTPALDQELGGLIMWVPGGFSFWIATTVIFFRWYAEERDPTPSRPPREAVSGV